MTSFAGSRSLDERRRRRLATENDQAEIAKPKVASTKSNDGSEQREILKSRLLTALPLRTIISHRRWKLFCLSCLSLLVGTGIIAAGWYVTQYRQPTFQPALLHLFDLKQSRTAAFYELFHITIAGQLCFLIGWMRSQSSSDFAGRFRIWKWAGMCAFAVAFSRLTSLYDAYLAVMTPLQEQELLAYPPVNYWLIPSLTIGALIFLRIQSDMRYCKTSRSLMWLAPVFGGAALGLELNPTFSLPVPYWNHEIARSGCQLAAFWSLVTSLLVHARFVTYFSIDSPQSARKPSLLSRMFGRRNAGPSLLDDDKESRTGSSTKNENSTSQKTVTSAKSTTRKAKHKNAAKTATAKAGTGQSTTTQAKPTPKKAEPVANYDEETDWEEDVEESPAPRQRNTSKNKSAAKAASSKSKDQPAELISLDDPEALKGLSKRERRQLRKQWREQERNQQSQRRAA